MDNAFDYIQGQMDTEFRATPDDNRPSFGEVVSASVGRAYDPLYEYLNDKKLEEIIDTIYQNKIPKPGSYTGRINAEPVDNRKTLLGNKNA